MKRLTIALALVLAACQSQSVSGTQTFTVTIAERHADRTDELLQASARIFERRLGSLNAELLDYSVTTDGTPTLTVSSNDAAALTQVTTDIQKPFTFELMLESPEETADIVILGQGGFSRTGITGTDLERTLVEEQEDGRARIELQMTPEGRQKLATLYAANPGKVIGMFVRDNLVSKLIADEAGLQERIVISNVPSLALAETFSDDVNVGIAATFSPKQ